MVLIENSICISKCVSICKTTKYLFCGLSKQLCNIMKFAMHSCEISMACTFSKYNNTISEESIVLWWYRTVFNFNLREHLLIIVFANLLILVLTEQCTNIKANFTVSSGALTLRPTRALPCIHLLRNEFT